MALCGKKVAANAIYILRTLIERALEVQRGLPVLIDKIKAFDRVRHDQINTHRWKKHLRVIKKLYREQKASMRVHGEMSPFKKDKDRVLCFLQIFPLSTVKRFRKNYKYNEELR